MHACSLIVSHLYPQATYLTWGRQDHQFLLTQSRADSAGGAGRPVVALLVAFSPPAVLNRLLLASYQDAVWPCMMVIVVDFQVSDINLTEQVLVAGHERSLPKGKTETEASLSTALGS